MRRVRDADDRRCTTLCRGHSSRDPVAGRLGDGMLGAMPLPDRWQTDRLLVRPWAPDDAGRVLDTLGRLEVVRWLGDGPPRPMADLAGARAAVDRWNQRGARPPHGTWAVEVRATGVLAGSVALEVLPRAEAGETEVAWWLHPDCWGRGYASEAARSVVARAFAAGLPEVLAVTHRGNDASGRVCGALGMRHEGVVEGPWYDVAMELYRLSAPRAGR